MIRRRAVYPERFLTPLSQVQLSDEGLQELLTAADEAELLATPPDYGIPEGIYDEFTTVITCALRGRR